MSSSGNNSKMAKNEAFDYLTSIKEHDVVTVVKVFDEDKVVIGEQGIVVHIYEGLSTLEVEFIHGVYSLCKQQVRKL